MRGLTKGARRVALVVATALLAPIGFVATTAAPSGAALPACTTTWAAAVDGDWSDGTKWSGGTAPTATDHVCITVPGDYTVALTGASLPYLTVGSLRLGSTSGPQTDAQELLVTRVGGNPQSSLTATGGIEVEDRGRLILGPSDGGGGGVSVGVGPAAQIHVAGGHIGQVAGAGGHTLRGDVVNQGSIHVDDPLRIEGDLVSEGSVHLNSVLRATGRVETRSGTFTGGWAVVAQSGLVVGAAVTAPTLGGTRFVVEDGGDIALETVAAVDITTYGTVSLLDHTGPGQDVSVATQDGIDSQLEVPFGWTNGGTLVLSSSPVATAAVRGSDLVNTGTIEVDEALGSAIEGDLVNTGTVISDHGDLTILGDATNEGRLDLGRSHLGVAGDLTLDETGELAVELTAEPPAAGRIDADEITVDGALAIHTEVAPAVGSGATILAGTEVTGTFASTTFTGSASYDIVNSGIEVDLVRRAPEPDGLRFLRAAYADFLDRAPTSQELALQGAAIEAGTLTRGTLVRQLSRSPEYVTTLVERFYEDTLDRPGDPDGIAFWVTQLRTGRWTVAQVAGNFYASPEYRDRVGDTDEEWIADLYHVLLFRSPGTDEKAYWVGRIAERGPSRVAVEIYQSIESRRTRVDRLYSDLLDRWADPDGLDYWAGRIAKEGDLALAVFLAASPEYLEQARLRYP